MRRVLLVGTVLVVAAGVAGAWLWPDSGTPTPLSWPRRLNGRLSCGGTESSPTFTAANLHGPPLSRAAVFADAPGRALRRWLGPRYGTSREGTWVMILRQPGWVMYLRRLNDIYAEVEFERHHGNWRLAGWGGCVPRYQGSQSWTIHALPDPAATSFVIGYTTGIKCNGPTHELLPLGHVDVRETSDAVRLTLYLAEDLPPPGWKPPPGVQACTTVGYWQQTAVTLARPMGRRTLFDGGHEPPLPVTPVPYGPPVDPGALPAS